MKKIVALSVLSTTVLFAGCFPGRPTETISPVAIEPTIMEVTETSIPEVIQNNTNGSIDATVTTDTTPAITQNDGYIQYNEASIAQALAEGKTVVYFFAASRCPSCVKADKEFTAKKEQLSGDSLLIVKVDYDSSQEMKKKYGITSQHTFVLVDSNNALVKKRSGSNAIDQVKAHIN